ncbi:hypothetical protein [Pelobium manganitolerans]|uniref:hypothetical protein n=1 Tax=Pelobium manganitolerans TaxID=1842495 RepID=UPI003FA35D35
MVIIDKEQDKVTIQLSHGLHGYIKTFSAMLFLLGRQAQENDNQLSSEELWAITTLLDDMLPTEQQIK